MTLEAAPVKVSRARRALSEIFAHLARSKAERVSVDDIVGRLSDRSIGACLVLFAAPNLLPLPPGVSSILAIPLIFVAAQLMIGTKGVWLPRPIRMWSLHSTTYRGMAHKLSGMMKKAEKFVRPRLRFITTPALERVLGAFALVLALVLLIPIPLGHLLPAFSLLVLGLGVMERDGLVAAAGVLCGVFSLGVIAGVSGGIISLLAR
jgi:hypothetical protein